MKHCIALLFSCLLGSGLVLPLCAQQGKLPAPPPLEQEEKVKLIKQFFKSEYSKKTPAGRVALGKLLLAKARREESDMAARYVFLSEAIDLSARGADLDNALYAFWLMKEDYLIDIDEAKEKLLSAVPRTKSFRTEEKIFKEWMALIDRSLAKDDYLAAKRLGDLVRKRVSRDKLLTRIARDKVNYIDFVAKRFKDVKPFLKKLADGPVNSKANGIVGEFLSLYKRDWKSGMELLSKGPVGELKKIADEELKVSKVVPDMQGVADGWWEIAQGHEDILRKSCLMRAAYWYSKSLDGLGSLDRLKVEKRLSDIEKEIGTSRGIDLSRLQVLYYRGSWVPYPLDKMTLSRQGITYTIKNTIGTPGRPEEVGEYYPYALLSSKRVLRGDFSATVLVYGGRAMGLTSENGRSKRLQIRLKQAWQGIRVERVGDKLTFTVNGKKVAWEPNHLYTNIKNGAKPNPEEASYLFISINIGQQCSLRKFEIVTSDDDTEEPGFSPELENPDFKVPRDN